METEALAKTEVVKIMTEPREWYLVRDEENQFLVLHRDTNAELARADTWGELLAKLTVLP